MSITKEKTEGSFSVNKMELVLCASYFEFKQIYTGLISDPKEREDFLNVVEKTVEDCATKNENTCIEHAEGHSLYVFKAHSEEFEDYVFLKDTITDNVYCYEINKVLH